jgi:hypothetical protein
MEPVSGERIKVSDVGKKIRDSGENARTGVAVSPGTGILTE